jgi:hypothetical protein
MRRITLLAATRHTTASSLCDKGQFAMDVAGFTRTFVADQRAVPGVARFGCFQARRG